MLNDNYQLRYLPLFYEDVLSATRYIRDKLLNPQAAEDLVDLIEEAILDRLPNCESFEPYHSKRNRKTTYYRIYVKNYVIYYVVIDDGFTKTMEVRRLLFNKQDSDNIL